MTADLRVGVLQLEKLALIDVRQAVADNGVNPVLPLRAKIDVLPAFNIGLGLITLSHVPSTQDLQKSVLASVVELIVPLLQGSYVLGVILGFLSSNSIVIPPSLWLSQLKGGSLK